MNIILLCKKKSVVVLAINIRGHGPMASAVARAYNEGLGVEPPAGSWYEIRGPPEAEALLVLGHSIEAANYAYFSKIW